jgi:aryl-alcohol dehydrogenase-like predicted oxidoreductase
MEMVALGDSGVQVSKVGLGTMMLGTAVDKQTSFGILDAYVEAGGSFLDTANMYSWFVKGFKGGESETLLGEWMRERNNRSEMFVVSKVGAYYEGVDFGLSADRIRIECEKSLKRMGIEVIDLYFAHVDDRTVPMEETLEAFDRLVQAGKVRYIGASNLSVWRIAQARMLSQIHGWARYCCVQQRYSYLRPNPGADFDRQIVMTSDLIDYCRSEGLKLIAFSPLLQGAYGRSDREFPKQYISPDSDARLAALKSVSQELGANPIQVVLAWMMQSDPAIMPLATAETVEQMRDNLCAVDIQLSTEQMACLNGAGA